MPTLSLHQDAAGALGSITGDEALGVLVKPHPLTYLVYGIMPIQGLIAGQTWDSTQEMLTKWALGGYAGLGDAEGRTMTLSRNSPTGLDLRFSDSDATQDDWTPSFDLSSESPGSWRIRTVWTMPSVEGRARAWGVDRWFTLLGDGQQDDGVGQIVSLFSYERPECNHVIYQTLNGDLIAKQGPS
ncbi:hypothetical protein LCGC14_2143630 [marine sediment metagenome]|uniref:Uncharacterized protein n=1 Tax=marine sediment metagenome TaxID=412755 RepID=A0A0F9GAN6_9ZZZZ|nr:hypothetical protein [Phycisphaerae bacterium]